MANVELFPIQTKNTTPEQLLEQIRQRAAENPENFHSMIVLTMDAEGGTNWFIHGDHKTTHLVGIISAEMMRL